MIHIHNIVFQNKKKCFFITYIFGTSFTYKICRRLILKNCFCVVFQTFFLYVQLSVILSVYLLSVTLFPCLSITSLLLKCCPCLNGFFFIVALPYFLGGGRGYKCPCDNPCTNTSIRWT